MSEILDVDKVRHYATDAGATSIGGNVGRESVQRLALTALAWLAERDAVTGEKIREIARLRKVREKLEDERNESRKDVANYERQIEDARAILGAAPEEPLSDAIMWWIGSR